MLFDFECFVCLWVLVCGVFNVLVRWVCDLSCGVAWVEFVCVCVLCLCVMLHVLISLFSFGGEGGVCVCAVVNACVFTICCVMLAELCFVNVE